MYPSTTIEIVDQSQYQRISTVAPNYAPTFLAAFAADRGTEDLTLFQTSDSWHDMYGDDISFKKYGQALKQAAMIIDNGGKLYSRRVVATDATLPNLAVYVKITVVKEHSTSTEVKEIQNGSEWVALAADKPTADPTEGKQWSYNFTTNEWEEIDESATANDTTRTRTVTDDVPGSVTLEYFSTSVTNCTTADMNTLVDKVENIIPASTIDNDTNTQTIYLPLFAFAAMGRGTYSPRFRITPSYRFSRSAGYSKCLIEIMGDKNDSTESMYFSVSPYKIERGASVSLDTIVNNNSSKLRVYQWEENIDQLYDVVGSGLGLTEEEKEALATGNLYFNTDIKGNRLVTKRVRARQEGETDAQYAQVPYAFNIVNESGFDFQSDLGNKMLNGDNGSFGDYPAVESYHDATKTDELTPYELYSIQLEKVFSEPDYTGVIGVVNTDPSNVFNTDAVSAYNIDSVAIDFIVDANYPEKVKNKIEDLVAWRNDTFFIRDMGLNIKNLSDVETCMASLKKYQYFTSIYCNSMDVLDDATMKYINVTIPYLMIPKLIQHYVDGPNRPFAGLRYSAFWIYGSRIRQGSINFLPKVTPSINEKEVIDNMGVNYVSILQGNKVTIETVYTTQHYNTTSQLSYSNNILAIQQVIKVLREKCPVARYAFADGEDLAEYQRDLLNELTQYQTNFMSFNISYAADATYEANKIYYAILEVTCREFFQAEKFRIVALPTESLG